MVYDSTYYPDFLSDILLLESTLLPQWMNEYLTETAPQPTKSIEANYMIDPIITFHKITEDF
jgi:hypothetical protein